MSTPEDWVMNGKYFGLKYALPITGVHMGYWYLYRVSNGETLETHTEYRKAVAAWEDYEQLARNEEKHKKPDF